MHAVNVAGGADHVAALAELDEVGRFILEAFKHVARAVASEPVVDSSE